MSDFRKAFEACAKDRGMNLTLDSTGAYWHGITFAAWLGWQWGMEHEKKVTELAAEPATLPIDFSEEATP